MSPSDHRRRIAGATSAGILSGLALTLSLLLLGYVMWSQGDLTFGQPTIEPRTVTPRGALSDEEEAVIAVFEETGGSVVNVSQVLSRVNFANRTVEGYASDAGTGIVWDKQGHIVTNFHVIQNQSHQTSPMGLRTISVNENLRVILDDEAMYDAELVGYSTDHDLAVLKIDAAPHRLHPLVIGSSRDLRVGQSVLAIGNPFGLQRTLTKGLISALNRTMRSPTDRLIENVIQTDAAINPGNSGGPLLDSAGRLIGVNTRIYSNSGNSAGIGFAVPVDVVNEVVPELIVKGGITQAVLGVQFDERPAFLPSGRVGAHIIVVAPDGAAEQAGLLGVRRVAETPVRGDVVLAVNDSPTRSRLDVLDAIRHFNVGDTVSLTLDREGEIYAVDVTLQALN
ncbi:MAG: trypsin-like peptidase domain-containing protein [Planctomycetota bacterium]|jgi:S1-C subfamily serine protease|nr:trypsin-like peptidase domain-containing protein [Planctomycetota bacterium]